MRQIIDGIAYDTDTSTQVIGGDHPHPMSDAWWGIYRTQDGAFFKIVVGHDGEIQECRTLEAAAARAELERHANHLVEKYFGSMPEPSVTRFSRRTVITAIEVMEGAITTHAHLTRCLLKWGFAALAERDGKTLADRFNCIIKFLDGQPNRRLEDGTLFADELVEKAVSLLPPPEISPWRQPSPASPRKGAFLRSLDQDGFTIADGVLRRTLPAVLNLPEAQDEIFRLLDKHSFAVPKGHLEQAFAAHTDEHWASANSQIRSFLDGLLDEIAERIDASVATMPSGQSRRAKLAALGFLSRKMNEWDDNGKGFINGLVNRLHPHGSHPGLSDQDDSTFRLHTVLLTARLLLVRFDAWGTN